MALLPSKAASLAPLLPSKAASHAPLMPSKAASIAPLLPSKAASLAPLLPSKAASLVPLMPSKAASLAPLLPSKAASLEPQNLTCVDCCLIASGADSRELHAMSSSCVLTDFLSTCVFDSYRWASDLCLKLSPTFCGAPSPHVLSGW